MSLDPATHFCSEFLQLDSGLKICGFIWSATIWYHYVHCKPRLLFSLSV